MHEHKYENVQTHEHDVLNTSIHLIKTIYVYNISVFRDFK